MKHYVYDVYRNKDDMPIIIGGTAEECAKLMGIQTESFYGHLCPSRQNRNKRYTILKHPAERDKIVYPDNKSRSYWIYTVYDRNGNVVIENATMVECAKAMGVQPYSVTGCNRCKKWKVVKVGENPDRVKLVPPVGTPEYKEYVRKNNPYWLQKERKLYNDRRAERQKNLHSV